jgi:hypothetical protein
VVPEFLIDDEIILPVWLLKMNLADVAEIGDGGLMRIGTGKGQ